MNSIIRLWTGPSSAFRFSRSVFFLRYNVCTDQNGRVNWRIQKSFQTDVTWMALLANYKSAPRAPANDRATSDYHFKIVLLNKKAHIIIKNFVK